MCECYDDADYCDNILNLVDTDNVAYPETAEEV